jgi:hypothetical protein
VQESTGDLAVKHLGTILATTKAIRLLVLGGRLRKRKQADLPRRIVTCHHEDLSPRSITGIVKAMHHTVLEVVVVSRMLRQPTTKIMNDDTRTRDTMNVGSIQHHPCHRTTTIVCGTPLALLTETIRTMLNANKVTALVLRHLPQSR